MVLRGIREAVGCSGRLTEMLTDLTILESYDRTYTQMIQQQVTPVLEELDRQFTMASSRIAMARQDLDMNRTGA